MNEEGPLVTVADVADRHKAAARRWFDLLDRLDALRRSWSAERTEAGKALLDRIDASREENGRPGPLHEKRLLAAVEAEALRALIRPVFDDGLAPNARLGWARIMRQRALESGVTDVQANAAEHLLAVADRLPQGQGRSELLLFALELGARSTIQKGFAVADQALTRFTPAYRKSHGDAAPSARPDDLDRIMGVLDAVDQAHGGPATHRGDVATRIQVQLLRSRALDEAGDPKWDRGDHNLRPKGRRRTHRYAPAGDPEASARAYRLAIELCWALPHRPGPDGRHIFLGEGQAALDACEKRLGQVVDLQESRGMVEEADATRREGAALSKYAAFCRDPFHFKSMGRLPWGEGGPDGQTPSLARVRALIETVRRSQDDPDGDAARELLRWAGTIKMPPPQHESAMAAEALNVLRHAGHAVDEHEIVLRATASMSVQGMRIAAAVAAETGISGDARKHEQEIRDQGVHLERLFALPGSPWDRWTASGHLEAILSSTEPDETWVAFRLLAILEAVDRPPSTPPSNVHMALLVHATGMRAEVFDHWGEHEAAALQYELAGRLVRLARQDDVTLERGAQCLDRAVRHWEGAGDPERAIRLRERAKALRGSITADCDLGEEEDDED